MESIIHADIFFFISSIATVVLSILIAILLYYLIKAGKNLRDLLDMVKQSYTDSEEFAEELKERFEENIIFQFLFPRKRKKRTTKDSN